MSNLDDQLRLALTREEPPEGFAERVLARLPREASNVVEMPARRRWAPLWLAVAAALVVAIGGTWAVFQGPEGGPDPNPVAGTVPPPTPPANANTSPEDDPKPPVTYGPTNKHRPPVEITRTNRRNKPARKPRLETVAPREREIDEVEWRAAEQFVLAMSITNEKIKTVRRNVLDTRAVPET